MARQPMTRTLPGMIDKYINSDYDIVMELAANLETYKELLAALKNFTDVEKPLVIQFLKDLDKGMSEDGLRKLDMDLSRNADAVYTGITVTLASGYSIQLNFNSAVNIAKATDPLGVSGLEYSELENEMMSVIGDHNNFAPDKEKVSGNIKIGIIDYDVTTGHRVLRITDGSTETSNLAGIVLHATSGSAIPNQNHGFTWSDSTSTIMSLLPYLGDFLKDTKTWSAIAGKNPLPPVTQGALTNDGYGNLSWTKLVNQKTTSIQVNISEDYTTNNMPVGGVAISNIAEVTTGGLPHADWGLPLDLDVPKGSLLFYTGTEWKVLDHSNKPRALLDTRAYPHPNIGQIGYDTFSNRLVIGLPTAAGLDPLNTTDPQAGWVDASPALSSGDLKAFLARSGDIAKGIESTKATTPQQVFNYLANDYMTLIDTKLATALTSPILTGLPVYIDEADASTAVPALPKDSLYKTATGELRIKLT